MPGRIRLSDGGVGDPRLREFLLESKKGWPRCLEDDGMSAGGRRSKESAFSGGVGDLRGKGAAGEIVPDDDVVEKVITYCVPFQQAVEDEPLLGMRYWIGVGS